MEVDYASKGEAERGHALPSSEEEWLRERDRKMRVMIAHLSTAPPLTQRTQPLHFGQAQLFPTTRRPVARELTLEADTTVDEWFTQPDINIYTGLSKSQLSKAPRIVVSLSSSGVSCNVRQIHDAPTITKRYPIDDLAVYLPREPLTAHPAAGRAVTHSRGAFGAPVAFVEGQRAFHLDAERPGMAPVQSRG